MVLEKGEPALAGVSRRGPLRQVAGDGGLGDFESQFQEFAVDPGSSPGGILDRHGSDEIAKLAGDFRSAGTTAGKEVPVATEPRAMPTTVSGFTIASTLAHCDQQRWRPSQNRRSQRLNRG